MPTKNLGPCIAHRAGGNKPRSQSSRSVNVMPKPEVFLFEAPRAEPPPLF